MKKSYFYSALIVSGVCILVLLILFKKPDVITALSTTAIAFFAWKGISDWKTKRTADACARAYYHFKNLEGILIQKDFIEALDIIEQQQDWFFSERVFLPDRLMASWLSLRFLARQRQRLQDKRVPFNSELASDIEKEIISIIKEAITEIYRILDKSELKVDTRGFDGRVSDYIRESQKRP